MDIAKLSITKKKYSRRLLGFLYFKLSGYLYIKWFTYRCVNKIKRFLKILLSDCPDARMMSSISQPSPLYKELTSLKFLVHNSISASLLDPVIPPYQHAIPTKANTRCTCQILTTSLLFIFSSPSSALNPQFLDCCLANSRHSIPN
jgi:hypothetical protein